MLWSICPIFHHVFSLDPPTTPPFALRVNAFPLLDGNLTFISCHPNTAKLYSMRCRASCFGQIRAISYHINPLYSLTIPPFALRINALSTLDGNPTFICYHPGTAKPWLVRCRASCSGHFPSCFPSRSTHYHSLYLTNQWFVDSGWHLTKVFPVILAFCKVSSITFTVLIPVIAYPPTLLLPREVELSRLWKGILLSYYFHVAPFRHGKAPFHGVRWHLLVISVLNSPYPTPPTPPSQPSYPPTLLLSREV